MTHRHCKTSLLAVVLVASTLVVAQPKHAQRAGASKPRPNILLVTIDTLRADHVGCYRFQNASTPTIDALAAAGVRFERAVSQVPLTWPSHASMLTGTYPFHNGVQDFTGQPLSPKFRSIAQALRDHGYATGAIVSSFVLDRSWGLSRGFDVYDDAFTGSEFVNKDLGLVERRARDSVDRAISWVAKPRLKPFFLWLHLYDPHSPYDPPEPFRSRFRDRPYDGEIAYADSELGRLVRSLKAQALFDNTAIILTSDHGESLGDHGEKEHGFFIYNSTVRVPLIIKPPRSMRRPIAVTEAPVELIGIAPTILEVAGIDDVVRHQFDGETLLSSKPGKTSVAYSETYYPFSSFGWSPLRGVQTADFHFIQAPKAEFYDLHADREERQNRIQEATPMVAAMQQKLREMSSDVAANTTNSTSDPVVQEKLRALGYVGYSAPRGKLDLQHLADPKDKLPEFENILSAADAFKRGNYEQGVELLNRVQESDPDMYLVPFMLGEAALRRQDWASASAHLAKALQLNPDFDQAMTGAARALYEQGKGEEAESWLKKALARNDANFRAWYELGWIQMRSEPDGAAESLSRALQIQPNFAPAYRDLGLLNFRKQQYDEAGRQLQRAADLGLRDARLFNFLGICHSRTGRLSEAVKAYRQALNIDADLAEAHLNLGFAYSRLNRRAEARSEYESACRADHKLCSMIPKEDQP